MGKIVESLSNRDVKRNASHHHMYVITCTLTNEDRKKNYKYPIS
jgi:hypothetical protein